MQQRRRTITETITIETAVIVVSDTGLVCGICDADSAMLSLTDARCESGLPFNRILELAEADSVHFVQTPGGHLLFCRNSIQKIQTIQGVIK